MKSSACYGSIAFRTVLYFACNPDEMLESSDVLSKFGDPGCGVPSTLKRAKDAGYLTLTPVNTFGGKRAEYFEITAGPELLKAIAR